MSVYSAQSSVDPLSKVSYSSYEPASQVFLDSHIGVSGPHIRQFLKWQDRNIRKAYLEWRHWEGRLSTDQRALLEQLYGQLVNLREGLRQQSTTLRHSWGPDVLQTTKLYRITSSTFQTHVKQTTEQARKRAKAEARAAQERSSRSSAGESTTDITYHTVLKDLL
ncbi:hypothetical protein OE88DRAFT_1254134 [Heliocybe sulcata]|uniref:Uncharacterized protein n=1 Tax=Heliocybe sulcata TaxID=5364 RepID=A0A5C3N6Q4_9AGAM|nr:hypothetical protein OE88DRAFT_1254134 [Heliocybe sulcata]